MAIAAAFVAQLYTSFLGRPADAAGLAFWQSAIDEGALSAAQATLAFVQSAEHVEYYHPVMRMYMTALGRTPDAVELADWVLAARGGASLSEMAAALTTSAEFMSGPGRLEPAALIATLYQNVLARPPDAAGAAFWETALGAGMPAADLLQVISQSAEGTLLQYDVVKYALLHQAIMGSVPSLAQVKAALPVTNWLGFIEGLYAHAEYTGVDVPGITRFVAPVPDVMAWDGGESQMPTLSLSYDGLVPLAVAATTDSNSVLGFAVGPALTPLSAGGVVLLSDLPMLETLTTGALVVRTSSGEVSAPTIQEVTIGTVGDDLVNASGIDTVQYVFTGFGSDTVIGGAGDDVIDTGAGNDALAGGDGEDVLFGGAGDDLIDGGEGSDTIYPGTGFNTILVSGLGGDDTVVVDAPSIDTDTFNYIRVTQASPDRWVYLEMSAGSPEQTLVEGFGDAYLRVDASASTSGMVFNAVNFSPEFYAEILAGLGDDKINGADGNDLLFGGDGNDQLFGGDGADSMSGEGNDDVFWFSDNLELRSDALVSGGDGIDTIAFRAPIDTLTSLSPQGDNFHADFYAAVGIERIALFGASQVNLGEVLVTAGVNTILTGDGATTLRYDTTELGVIMVDASALPDGFDLTLLGGGDIYVQSFSVSDLRGNLNARDLVGAFNVTSAAGEDFGVAVWGGAGNDTIMGSAGNDLIAGGAGSNWIEGGGGMDTFIVDRASTGFIADLGVGGHDELQVAAGSTVHADVLESWVASSQSSNFGSVTLVLANGINANLTGAHTSIGGDDRPEGYTISAAGNSAASTIAGSLYNDTIMGGSGNDVLAGGGNTDALFGNSGNDRFLFATIAEFVSDGVIVDAQIDGGDHFDRIEINQSVVINDTVLFDNLSAVEALVVTGRGASDLMLNRSAEVAGIGEIDIANSQADGNRVDVSTYLFLGTTVIGSATHSNTLVGGQGNDILRGGLGNDWLEGGPGLDNIYLSGGEDTLVIRAKVDDSSDSNNALKDIVHDMDGDDFINVRVTEVNNFDAALDVSMGGFYYLVNTNNNDNWFEVGDIMLASYNWGEVSDEHPLALNFSSEDALAHTIFQLSGTTGNDTIAAGPNDDTLIGGQGNDTLMGRDGDDQLVGSAGADVLTGGLGMDNFVYSSGSTGTTLARADTITDFQTGVDRIQTGLESLNPSEVRIIDGSLITFNFNAFVAAANVAFSPLFGAEVFVATNARTSGGNAWAAINNDLQPGLLGQQRFSSGDTLIVLTGINQASEIAASDFIGLVV